MSKQKNETIGAIDCTACGEASDIRRTDSGKLYIQCAECGTDIRHGKKFQEYILKHGKFTESPLMEEGGPEPEPVAEEKPAPTPARAPEKIKDEEDTWIW